MYCHVHEVRNERRRAIRLFRFCLAAAVLSASLARSGDTFVRVESEKGTRLSETLWKSEWGSYQKARTDIRHFSVKVRNHSNQRRTYIIGWYSIAKNHATRDLSVSCWGRVERELGPTDEVIYHVVSDRIVSLDENYKALGQQYFTGGEFNGYLVTVREGNEFIRKIGSKLSSSQFVENAMNLARQVNPDLSKA
jgi:hypothetical protein